jgi:nucleoporin SEH1
MALQALAPHHSDLVTDLKYSKDGSRLASCSADQHVRVWDAGEDDAAPTLAAQWRAHGASIARVAWAPPQYGSVLASGAADHKVLVWEEHASMESAASKWKKTATLGDARRAVTDVAFAPEHVGLKLAAASDDGMVRVYEALDPMSLGDWTLTDEMDFNAQAPPAAASAAAAAAAAGKEEGGVTAVSWCDSAFDVAMLAAGGSSGRVAVWAFSQEARRWTLACELQPHARPVRDVAWAPQCGRSFHLVATSSYDNALVVHRLGRAQDGVAVESAAALVLPSAGAGPPPEVWRLSWNVVGTVLAAAYDDGVTRMWRCGFGGEWAVVSELGVGEAGAE